MTETLRVCQVVASFRPVVGGVERATETLARELQVRGVDLVIVTRRYPGLPRFERVDGLPVHRLGLPGRSKLAAFSFSIHALWLLATRFGQYRLIHVQNIDTPLLVGLLAKVLLDRSVVATIHGEAKVVRKRATKLGQARLSMMRRLVDAYGALTPAMRAELLKLGVSTSRIHVIPNGIDTSVFYPPSTTERRQARRQLQLTDASVVTLFAGRLIRLKRVDTLLRAWASLPPGPKDVLVIVGDGPERGSLENLSDELGLTNVRFAGRSDVMLRYLHAADVFVLPSEEEGLSLALLEAMACGLPVVVTDLPGHRTLIQHNKNGLLIPPDSLMALTKAVRNLIRSQETRGKLGFRAAEFVRRRASAEAVAERHLKLYGSLRCSSSSGDGIACLPEDLGAVSRSFR